MARRQGGWFCNMMVFILFVIWIFVSGLRKSRKFFSWLIYESALFRNLTFFYHTSSFVSFLIDSLLIISHCFWSNFESSPLILPSQKIFLWWWRRWEPQSEMASPFFKSQRFGIEGVFISSPYNIILLSVLSSDRPTHQFELFSLLSPRLSNSASPF